MPLLVCPGGAECSLSSRTVEDHWEGSGSLWRAQPARHRNRGTPCIDSPHGRGGLRSRRDEGATRLGWLCPPALIAQASDRCQKDRAARERGRVGNTPGKTLDHAWRPGLAAQLPAESSVLHRSKNSYLEEDLWRGCRDRTQ